MEHASDSHPTLGRQKQAAQGHPQLHSEFEDNPDHIRPCLNKQNTKVSLSRCTLQIQLGQCLPCTCETLGLVRDSEAITESGSHWVYTQEARCARQEWQTRRV